MCILSIHTFELGVRKDLSKKRVTEFVFIKNIIVPLSYIKQLIC